MQMVVATVVVGAGVAGLIVLIATGLWDNRQSKARAIVEARSYEQRPFRRRVPRSATFIVHEQHVPERLGGSGPSQRRFDGDETVVVVETGVLARSEAR